MNEASKANGRIAILGVFVADAVYRASRMPEIGETLLGNSFALGPGGKGSNQSVAAARAGADVTFITRLGKDPFAEMALKLYEEAGVNPLIEQLDDSYTGSAFIFVDDKSGDNAIIIAPGAATTITPEFVDSAKTAITAADVFITQLEQPIDAATHALTMAKNAGVTTILNTAPAESIADSVFQLCDYVTPSTNLYRRRSEVARRCPSRCRCTPGKGSGNGDYYPRGIRRADSQFSNVRACPGF